MGGVMTYKNKILVVALCFILSVEGFSQDWSGEHQKKLNKNWAFEINAGVTSYYGDLSSYENDFIGKLQHESGKAFGVILSKEFSPVFSISGQLLSGKLKGSKGDLYMKSDLFEYNLHARVNLVELFSRFPNRRLGIIGFAGIGNFLFWTLQLKYYEGGFTELKHHSRVPEFLYFFGGGLSYKITPKISINTEISIKKCENDKLDIYVARSQYDYYSYLKAGLCFKINNIFRPRFKTRDGYVQNDFRPTPIYRKNLQYRK